MPSVEYQRIIHARYLKQAQSDVDMYESLLAGLKDQPVEHGKEMWEHRRVSDANSLKVYSGSGDAAFLAMLRADYQTGLVESQQKLRRVKAAQP